MYKNKKNVSIFFFKFKVEVGIGSSNMILVEKGIENFWNH